MTDAIKPSKESRGCRDQVVRILKKIWPIDELVDFDAIFGGEAITLGRVSKMDVRDGTMGLPVAVVSQ